MLLFAFAIVKSDLMQIAMALPATAVCGDMAAMPGMAASTPQPDHGHPAKVRRDCLYCDAAAHVPLVADALPIPEPRTVAWLPTRPTPLVGPRGPPAFRPNARGPPAFPIA